MHLDYDLIMSVIRSRHILEYLTLELSRYSYAS